ncbi:RrF2 family transcriptional regulator [Algibacter sp. PT7-4]|uniref:RrF2 family transcriptional regulator n=1 Tax=Algibacter ulvanivorans TaxID=3400999 RepID=UPI003AAC9627
MFSKSCEYGLRAVIYIAQQSKLNNKVSLNKISEEINSPQAFTAKILQQLTRNNIIKSIKGPYGGFIVEKDKMTTKLSEVVSVLDGDSIYTGCGLGLKECDAKAPCPLHFKFADIRERLKVMLESTTLVSITDKLDIESTILKP